MSLQPPKGYSSWLDYAVAYMPTRDLHLGSIMWEDSDEPWGREVQRAEMEEAVKAELAQFRAEVERLKQEKCVNGCCWYEEGEEQRKEIEQLKEELADRDAWAQTIISEKCPTDEIHCGCVPTLRRGIEELGLKLTELRELVDGARTIVELWNATTPTQVVWKNKWLMDAIGLTGLEEK